MIDKLLAICDWRLCIHIRQPHFWNALTQESAADAPCTSYDSDDNATSVSELQSQITSNQRFEPGVLSFPESLQPE